MKSLQYQIGNNNRGSGVQQYCEAYVVLQTLHVGSTTIRLGQEFIEKYAIC